MELKTYTREEVLQIVYWCFRFLATDYTGEAEDEAIKLMDSLDSKEEDCIINQTKKQ